MGVFVGSGKAVNMGNKIRIMDPVLLTLYQHRFAGVSEEMGVTLQRTSYSPNIKERLDFSCAVFDGVGRMIAQAAHIPVHLGAMPASVEAALQAFTTWEAGDVVMLNDPFEVGRTCQTSPWSHRSLWTPIQPDLHSLSPAVHTMRTLGA